MEDLSLSTLVWLRMVRFVENSNQLSNDHLRQFDLTLAQFEALAHIRNFQPITQTDLARGLTVTGGGISRMLSRLESEGLISRQQDWKTKHISLTDKGTELLERAYPSQLEQQASLFDEVLDEDEKTQLHALMKKLYEHSITRREDDSQS
ncbi:MAG: MarR family winged helix-turn-helix transcriptional regulator [Brevibacterium aurantiacum]|uniref:MarR family transcriptional regulator n=1 Tax=Brevibacterium aurantiacum TaxID=273384 RepID=A0A1D7W750_BREAU|nr:MULTISPECIES: MarR family transcriptional regulator [Brevibacterium]MDN5594042.1 MarR family transcriptional regulator [Brevibacterium sp.]AOP54831.1 Transcriptional regulator, MarR family [Brevibacterium aurantiacum]AZL06780.1 MarR family transcriptional regulator [Brevibacterium aurantiacum]AZL10323.1 MarR family transcriptional regulator [Brevibacterium aurantiacum]AZL14007.1 MarR family transcriptional regulator [Brevibacterium aurantiacum]